MSPINDRRSHQRCSTKKAVLKNFAMFIGKQLYWSLFLIIKRDSNTGVLQRQFNTGECCEFLKNTILKNIHKRLLRNRFLKGHLTSYTNTTLTNQLVSSTQIVHIRIRTIKAITSYIMYIIIYNLVLFPRKF